VTELWVLVPFKKEASRTGGDGFMQNIILALLTEVIHRAGKKIALTRGGQRVVITCFFVL
jgi:hypothetical protein